MSLAAAPPRTTLMASETAEGPAAAGRVLARNEAVLRRIAKRFAAHPPAFVVTCARGSSDHAATYGKYLIEILLGLPTVSAALSVSSVFETPLARSNALCLAISQSGRSPDLLRAVRGHQEAGAFVVALVNDETSPLAELADEVLALSAGPERSVAATKSFIASLTGLAALVAACADAAPLKAQLDDLEPALAKALALDWSPALPLLIPARNLFVMGRGYSFGVAQEAALKLKETSGLHAEAFSSAEVRHGPMAIVKNGFPVLGFATSDAAGDDVRQAAGEFRERGAQVLLAGEASGLTGLPSLPANPVLQPILMIQSFYRLAETLARERGLDPDHPPFLRKVTETL